ncbi:MAG: hypothetical protein AABY22_07850 [Nanoarchaeota archaeon]
MKFFLFLLFCFNINGAELLVLDPIFIKIIHKIESNASTKTNIVGDNGRAIGPLQIHFACWSDAVKFNSKVSNKETNNVIRDNKEPSGPLQIHYRWRLDNISANNKDNYANNKDHYTNCFELNYSIKIMTAYLNKYERKSIQNRDFESLARCWNDGPNWRNKRDKTNNYWRKFKKFLTK